MPPTTIAPVSAALAVQASVVGPGTGSAAARASRDVGEAVARRRELGQHHEVGAARRRRRRSPPPRAHGCPRRRRAPAPAAPQPRSPPSSAAILPGGSVPAARARRGDAPLRPVRQRPGRALARRGRSSRCQLATLAGAGLRAGLAQHDVRRARGRRHRLAHAVAVAHRDARARRRRADRTRLHAAGRAGRAVDGLADRRAGGTRSAGARALRRRDGHVRAEDRLHLGVGGGRDRPAPLRRDAAAGLRDDPLRAALLPRRGARRRRAVGGAALVHRLGLLRP